MVSAAILAGGKNSRMGGENKAFLQMEGRPIIQKTISVLTKIFADIIVVTNSPHSYTDYAEDVLIVRDKIKEVGPLGGMYTALTEARSEAVFFIACDMPFLHNEVIEEQVREFRKVEADAFIPRIGNCLEPLHGIYRTRIAAKLQTFLIRGKSFSIREFLETVPVSYWELEDTEVNRKYFININSPEELKEVRGTG